MSNLDQIMYKFDPDKSQTFLVKFFSPPPWTWTQISYFYFPSTHIFGLLVESIYYIFILKSLNCLNIM